MKHLHVLVRLRQWPFLVGLWSFIVPAALTAPGVFFAMAWVLAGLMVTAFMIIGPVSSYLGSIASVAVYHHSASIEPRAPMSQVDRLLLNEDWDGAELALRELARTHPHDHAVWPVLFRTVWLRVGQRDRAREAHELMLKLVHDPARRTLLTELFIQWAGLGLGEGPALEYETLLSRRRLEDALAIEAAVEGALAVVGE